MKKRKEEISIEEVNSLCEDIKDSYSEKAERFKGLFANTISSHSYDSLENFLSLLHTKKKAALVEIAEKMRSFLLQKILVEAFN